LFFKRIAVGVAVGGLMLTGCSKTKDVTTSSSSTAAGAAATTTTQKKSDVKVGLAYDIGGRGDKSFNDSAAKGLDKAKSSLGVDVKELSAIKDESAADKEARLKLLADGGYNPIVAVGFAYADAIKAVAAAYPAVSFAIVDDPTAAANITNLLFAENESSYLVGAVAALKSKTGNIGFIGGVNVPLIQKFQAGYAAGAKKIKPDIKIQAKYITQPPDFTGFNDPANGKTIADGMFDAGADVVYAAAGGSGNGLFQSAKAKGKLAIGVDSDQYEGADAAVKDVIISSALKKVDVAVYDFIKSFTDKAVKTGPFLFNLKNDGVGYATSGGKVDDIKTDVEKLKADIIAGTITVPEKL
jgi:basic membrane protein A